MAENKRGLSTIVVTLIIVLLSLVAVGVVWVVVRGLINTGSQGVEINSKCLAVTVEASKVNCSNGAANITCDVTFTRTGTGSDAIAGVKLVFRDTVHGVNSNLISLSGNIEALVGKTQTGINTGVPIANTLNDLDVTAFFTDSSGNEQLCSETNSFTF
jgi:hypothetical protein